MNLSIDNIILIGSVLLFLSIFAGKTGYRFGIPTLVLFLGVGMIFGSDGLGIQFNNPDAAQFVGMMALNVILFSGGMDTKLSDIKPIIGEGITLATIGVLTTALFTGFFIYWLTNNFFGSVTFTLLEALLLASVMSSTDSASVFGILRSKNICLKEKLQPILEFESGSNDPMAYLLTITMIQLIKGTAGSVWEITGFLFLQLTIGALFGYLLGKIAVWIFNKINLENLSLYPVLLIAFMFLIYSLTNDFKGNGFLAVYISGLVIGNAKFTQRHSCKRFFDGLTWLFQIIMFITLGLLVNPRELLPIAAVGLLISFFLIFVSRPLSVFLCLAPFRKLSQKARIYTSWVGLRGAVPIIFATYPLTEGIDNAHMIFNIVFFVTLVSLLVQGTTIPSVAKWLKLSDDPGDNAPLTEFDIEFPDEIGSSMKEMIVEQDLLENGNRIMDVSLPKNVLVMMIKRGEEYIVPKGSTLIFAGDILLLISDDNQILKEN